VLEAVVSFYVKNYFQRLLVSNPTTFYASELAGLILEWTLD